MTLVESLVQGMVVLKIVLNGWPYIELKAKKTDGIKLDETEVKAVNDGFETIAAARDSFLKDPWKISIDGALSLENVITTPDDEALDLLMEAKSVLDDHGLDFDGVIYFLNEKQNGVMRWTIKADMVTDTLDVIDENYPNYGAGEPITVTFPDGTEVHVMAD